MLLSGCLPVVLKIEEVRSNAFAYGRIHRAAFSGRAYWHHTDNRLFDTKLSGPEIYRRP